MENIISDFKLKITTPTPRAPPLSRAGGAGAIATGTSSVVIVGGAGVLVMRAGRPGIAPEDVGAVSPGSCRDIAAGTSDLVPRTMAQIALLLAPTALAPPQLLRRHRSRSALITLSTATPDPTLNTILVNSADFNSQPLPLSYCERWPLWVADSTGVALTLLPGFDEESEESGWCNPSTFEQLWLPQDLPAPVCTPALGVVLKDGAPSYVFPSFEATVSTKQAGGERVWHNRGLRSAPLAKTWLHYGESPPEALRLSPYHAMTAGGEGEAEVCEQWAHDVSVDEATVAVEYARYCSSQ